MRIVVLAKAVDERSMYAFLYRRGMEYTLLRLNDAVYGELARKWCVWTDDLGKIRQGRFLKKMDEILEILKRECKYEDVTDEEWMKLFNAGKDMEKVECIEEDFVIEGNKDALRELCRKCGVRVITIQTLKSKLNRILKERYGVEKMIHYCYA